MPSTISELEIKPHVFTHWHEFEVFVLKFRLYYGEANSSGDDYHWKDSFYSSHEEKIHHTMLGHMEKHRIDQKAGREGGKYRQEPVL